MQNKDDNKTFSYTYSAIEQEEVKRIRQKYQPQEESKMDTLRKLDASASKKATTYSIAVGISGALVMGIGMSLVMTDIGSAIGLTGMLCRVTGIMIGIIGIAGVCAAYPLYSNILKKEQKKIAPEILRLTEELMK